MDKLSHEEDIWVEVPTHEDLQVAADYAAITLPWTFNRMMMNTSSRGQNQRALNIAKGIVVQETLGRALEKKGVSPQTERKSHRDTDLFDFQLPIMGEETKMDIKSMNYYEDYDVERPDFSKELIIENKDYAGEDWRRFFPMLLPHTQINQDKEAYCFAIAKSVDFRKDISTDRSDYQITAFPNKEMMPFLNSRRLIRAREEKDKGIYIKITYAGDDEDLFDVEPIDLTVLGAWKGEKVEREATVTPGETVESIGPFSCVSSFQMNKEDFNDFRTLLEIGVSENELEEEVLNTSRRNENAVPEDNLKLDPSDFCNLILPSSYELYFLGWLPKDEYLATVEDYTGWVWPKDSKDKYANQAWSQITESDRGHLKKAGYDHLIQEDPSLLNAGWMKTHGRGGGACCYIFPNIGARGGVRENNLYVLPGDLYTMDELC
jgi:hypothetical protein